MDEVLQAEKSENGIYELGFLLVPDITEEKLSEVFGNLKDVLSEKGAVIFAEEFPKNIALAYTMEKTINNKIGEKSIGTYNIKILFDTYGVWIFYKSKS